MKGVFSMLNDKKNIIEATVVTVPSSESDMITLLTKIQQDTEQQKKLQQKKLTLSRITTLMITLLSATIITTLAWGLPTFNNLVENVDIAIVQLTTVMGDIETIAKEIQEAELVKILNNVDGLLEETNEKISALDVDELNQAVKNLGDAVSPLAKLFGGRD